MPILGHTHIALNAHLLSDDASYRSAGIHGYLFNTLRHLPAVDAEIDYTLFTGEVQLPDNPRWNVLRSWMPGIHPAMRIAWEQLVAPVELARLKPDLYHGMGFSLPIIWPGPMVVTIFDLSFLRYPERLGAGRRIYLQIITRVSARKARRIIAISDSGRKEISALLGIPARRIDIALPGVGQEFRRLPSKTTTDFRLRRKLPGRFILYVGTLEPRKNIETLLKAYAQLPQRKEVKLVLAGGRGWQTRPIFALIEELNLQDDIVMPGYVSIEELPMWYNAAELLAYPSIYEGFGLPVLEAMACGLPVITSNSTSLPEATGPGGILVAPTDVEAWKEGLIMLLDDHVLRSEQAKRGQQHAKNFTWERCARQTALTYRRALANE